MDEAGVRDCLLARAVEEVDEEGGLVGQRARSAAGREARAEAQGDRERFLALRARRLIAPLVTEQRAVARVRDLSGRAAVPGWLAFALAFAIGLLIDRIGASQRINVLSFPLLGLLLWNVVAYAFFASGALSRLGSARARAAQAGVLARAMHWVVSPERVWVRGRRAEESGLLTRALERYLVDWTRVGARLHLARARLAMHASAAGLVLGLVVGMYVRGLVLDYRAGWESTFLSAAQVRAVLAFFLGPAARLLGTEIPDVETIAGMRVVPGREGDASAALWIHLYSVTALAVVVLPRLALGFAARRRVRALRSALPVDWEADSYFLRLFAADRGGGARAEILPYSFRPSARASEGLQSLLLDLLGNRTRIEVRAPLEYGTPDGGEPEGDGEELTRALLFNLAQSPEQEVHGELLEREKAGAESAAPARRLLVVIDESRYRERLGRSADADERMDARRRAWQRVLRECGLEGLFAELDGALEPELLARAQDALWPPRAAGVPA